MILFGELVKYDISDKNKPILINFHQTRHGYYSHLVRHRYYSYPVVFLHKIEYFDIFHWMIRFHYPN